MASRQEKAIEAPHRPATTLQGAIPKFKNANWANLPDYDKLPSWSLIDKREVCLLTSMSASVLDKRIAVGEFRQPVRHGKNHLWQLGYVRDWIQALFSKATE